MSESHSVERRQAFTLVELSIVLVILGLLVGGVLTGQSLIHAAELRSITRESAQYTTAIYTFRDKYMALPGDMPNAVRYWGAMAGGTADGSDSACESFVEAGTASTGTKTCNGNGNGMIAGGTPYVVSSDVEAFAAWKHMANAGLVEGTYTGVAAFPASAGRALGGFNAPKSKFATATWSFDDHAYDVGTSSAAESAVNLCIGAPIDDTSCTPRPIFKPEDAYNLDVKMDDGMPYVGKVSVPQTLTPDCAANEVASATYNLAQQSISCALVMVVAQ